MKIKYLLVTVLAMFIASKVFAKDITLLYSGQTHAMLYTCSCPIENDGGIARRAALIKQLRKENSDVLVIDSGAFFAGGLLDEYTQNTQLDTQRALVNLKAMELMKYDAVALSDDEFNFGKEFLQENIAKTKLKFLACNIKMDGVLPYIIKDVSGVSMGIIGVTPQSASLKAVGLKIEDPKQAVTNAIQELRKQNVNFILVLSHMGEAEDLNLINSVAGINVLITGHSNNNKEGSFSKIGNTLLLRPSWQGRKLGRADFSVKDNMVVNPRVEEMRLSDKITDDPDALAILPRCFSEKNCRKEGLIGSCQNPGSLSASCVFSEANKISLVVITVKHCITCNTDPMVSSLKRYFPGLTVSYVYYPDKKADKLLKDFAIRALPVYLLGKEAGKDKTFESMKASFEEKGDYYMLKQQFSGFSYFTDRGAIKGKLDLFISIYDKNTPELLEVTKEFNPIIHFLAFMQDGKFDAAKGNLEIEDDLRAVCVQKYYPQNFSDYISCRANNTNTSWWDDCASGLDSNKIMSCAKSPEANSLLKENVSLTKDLQIMFGPTYLMDNQEIFSTKGVPTKEELKKILRR